MPRVPLVPAAAAATVASLRKPVSLSSLAAAFGLPAATPGAHFCFLAGGVGVCLPFPWRPSFLLSSGRGFLLRPLPRWTYTSRRVNNSSSSEDSSYRRSLPVLPAGAAAEGAAACSSHYYLVLTALLSSAALLTVGRDSRRRRFPVACDAAAPGTATQHLQREGEYSPSAASTSSSALSSLQDVSPPCTRLAGSCGCSHVRRSSSSSLSGGSSRWTRRSEGIGERKGSSRSSSVRRKDVRSRCTHSRSSGMCSSCKSRASAAALRRERVLARCAAAEGGVSWLPPAAGLCETSDLPAEAGRSGRKGVVEEQQQEGRNASVPSSWAAASADSKTRQTGQQESTIQSASTARASSSVAGAAGADITRDGGAGGQADAVGETHRWSAAAGEEPQQHHHHDSPLWRSEENRPFEKKLEDALLFCGNSNQPLATAVADRLSTKLGKVAVKRFADGEVNIQFLDSLRGKDVYLIQPTSSPVNEHLMELLLMISTCRRASAKKITAVIPYYGYARQDRKLSSRVPISAADVARMIEAMGVDRVVAVDLHCGQIQGFFGPRVPVDNLEAQIIGLEYFQHKNLQKPVVVSPDAGGVYRARKFQEGLLARGYRDCGIAMLIKQRLRANEIERMDLVGSVEGSDVIIVDDMIDTAGTLCEAARELRAKGARRVFAFATHGLFSGPAINRIESSPLEEVVVTDSIQARREVLSCPRITSLSISVLLADAIRRIHQKESLNDLFMVKSWQ